MGETHLIFLNIFENYDTLHAMSPDFLIRCPIKKYLGFECLGCGAQRALLMVFQGRFGEALQVFPAIYTIILLFILIGINALDKKRNYTSSIFALVIINIIIMLVSYYYRHF